MVWGSRPGQAQPPWIPFRTGGRRSRLGLQQGVGARQVGAGSSLGLGSESQLHEPQIVNLHSSLLPSLPHHQGQNCVPKKAMSCPHVRYL